MRKDSILQNYYYKKLPEARVGIQTTGDPTQPYHPITNPQGYRNKISDVLKVAQKRQQESSDATPTIRQGHKELPYETRERQQRLREESQQNSDLAQTMSLFTPSGSNTAAGAAGAENFVNMNPLISGPIMSTSRLYGAGRSMVDPDTYNPYFNSDNGVTGNILGSLQLAGDLGMVHTALRTPSGNFNPTVDISKETYWPDFGDRNFRVKQAWENAKSKKAGISTTYGEYAKRLQQEKLKQQAGDVLRTMGIEDPNKGGWSATHTPETNSIIRKLQHGEQPLENPNVINSKNLLGNKQFPGFNIPDYFENLGADMPMYFKEPLSGKEINVSGIDPQELVPYKGVNAFQDVHLNSFAFNPLKWFSKEAPAANTPASSTSLQENLAAARNQAAGTTPPPAGRPASSAVTPGVKTPFWKKALRTGVGLGIASAVPASIIHLSNEANSTGPVYSNLPISPNVDVSDTNVVVPQQYMDTSNINPNVYDTLGIPNHAYGGYIYDDGGPGPTNPPNFTYTRDPKDYQRWLDSGKKNIESMAHLADSRKAVKKNIDDFSVFSKAGIASAFGNLFNSEVGRVRPKYTEKDVPKQYWYHPESDEEQPSRIVGIGDHKYNGAYYFPGSSTSMYQQQNFRNNNWGNSHEFADLYSDIIPIYPPTVRQNLQLLSPIKNVTNTPKRLVPPPPPSLHPNVLNVQPINTRTAINTPGITNAPEGYMDAGPITQLPYRVDYRDEQGQLATKRFLNEAASEDFFNNVRVPYTGVQGYYDRTPKQAYGGPLVDYYAGKMNHGEMFANGGASGPGDGIGGFFKNLFGGGHKGWGSVACPTGVCKDDSSDGGGLHIGDFLNTVGHGVEEGVKGVGHFLGDVGEGIWHDISSIGDGHIRKRKCQEAGMEWDPVTKTCKPKSTDTKEYHIGNYTTTNKDDYDTQIQYYNNGRPLGSGSYTPSYNPSPVPPSTGDPGSNTPNGIVWNYNPAMRVQQIQNPINSYPNMGGRLYGNTIGISKNGGTFIKAQDGITFPFPYSNEVIDKYQKRYNDFYNPPMYHTDDMYDDFFKKITPEFQTKRKVEVGPTWSYNEGTEYPEFVQQENFPKDFQKKIDKGKASKSDFKYYPNYFNEETSTGDASRLVTYLQDKNLQHGAPNFMKLKKGGVVNLDAIINQNREDRDNNSYSGDISKYAQGGVASNEGYYNVGMGVPHIGNERYGGDVFQSEAKVHMANGGGLLSRTVTCSNCGHSWKGVTGGADPLTCHDCGGIIKMNAGGDISIPNLSSPLLQFYNGKVQQFAPGGLTGPGPGDGSTVLNNRKVGEIRTPKKIVDLRPIYPSNIFKSEDVIDSDCSDPNGPGCSYQATRNAQKITGLPLVDYAPSDAAYRDAVAKRTGLINIFDQEGDQRIAANSSESDWKYPTKEDFDKWRAGDIVTLDAGNDIYFPYSAPPGFTEKDNSNVTHNGVVVGFTNEGLPVIKHGYAKGKNKGRSITEVLGTGLKDVDFEQKYGKWDDNRVSDLGRGRYAVKSVWRPRGVTETGGIENVKDVFESGQEQAERKAQSYQPAKFSLSLTEEEKLKNELPVAYNFSNANTRLDTKNNLVNLFNDKGLDKELQYQLGITAQDLQNLKPVVFGIAGQESNSNDPSLKGSIRDAAGNLLNTGNSKGLFQIRFDSLTDQEKKVLGVKSPKDLLNDKTAYKAAILLMHNAKNRMDSEVEQGTHPQLENADPYFRAAYYYNSPARAISTSKEWAMGSNPVEFYNPTTWLNPFISRGTIAPDYLNKIELRMDKGSYPYKVMQKANELNMENPSIGDNASEFSTMEPLVIRSLSKGSKSKFVNKRS